MTDYQKDILVGAIFIAGVFSVISGAFIITLMLIVGTIFFSTTQRLRPVKS